MSVYTWEEVAKHNTAKSLWVYAEDKVYDITPWLERHPGGKTVLLLAGGRDVTDLLPSYHPFSDDKLAQTLAKFEIGRINSFEFPRYKKDSGFYAECRKRVGEYFKETGKDYKDVKPGLIAMFFVLILVVASVLYSFNRQNPFYYRVLATVVFGIATSIPLLHIMHDASHTAFSHSPWFWDFTGKFTMDFLNGTCITSWYHQHILGHHIYTNVLGVDPDLPAEISGDIRRVVPKQLWSYLYKYQHIYLPFLYGVMAIKFRIQDIVGTLIQQMNGSIRMNPQPIELYIRQILSKILYIYWRIYIPLFYLQMEVLEFLVLYLVAEFSGGLYLAFNFQVSHVSPGLHWPEPDPTDISGEWAVEQVQTSVDYGHGDRIATFLSGALNHQSVHHLFPAVSQYHYPAIAPIVVQVCEEYGVNFNYLPNFFVAFRMHLKHLADMGQKQMP